VHSYTCSSTADEHKAGGQEAKPLRSSLRKTQRLQKAGVDSYGSPRSMLSGSSNSTVASAGDLRRVSFCDGISLGEEVDARKSMDDDSGIVQLAEWIYVDRDICGFSLCEYAPTDAYFKDFASSYHAYHFLGELSKVESLNHYEQYEAMMCSVRSQQYIDEEIELNQSLTLAGVKPRHLIPMA